MKKRDLLLLLVLWTTSLAMAQTSNHPEKMSAHLAHLADVHTKAGAPRRAAGGQVSVCALLTLTQGQMADVARDHGLTVIDSIGRIYIVRLPLRCAQSLADDMRVERVEAERMPRTAMDVTPGQVNATPVYAGTQLPQAFTGQGVAAGVFDCGFDLTHPAFRSDDGTLRIKYYYDFNWPNDDGTTGHALTDAAQILEYGHSQHVLNQTHGAHVTGIMAGSAVQGKYQGMAPEADLLLADFDSKPSDFENPDLQTSAVAVLGFKYIFDQAARAAQPCVVNFSSCESLMLTRQRTLEAEALEALTGPGRIIVAAAGNDGTRKCYFEKPDGVKEAGTGLLNGIRSGGQIEMDLVTEANQTLKFGFLGMLHVGTEQWLTFSTDSIDSLQGDTCVLHTTVSSGDIEMRIWRAEQQDPRGRIYRIRGIMPSVVFLVLYGATMLVSGDGPAWAYSDLYLSPFTNVTGSQTYSYAKDGYTVSWPATLPGIVGVGATAYKTGFRNLKGDWNAEMEMFAPTAIGRIAAFSSCGPTMDGRTKPDVVAPGMNINAPFNSFANYDENLKELTDEVSCDGKTWHYMAQSGTSMASPVVAGAVALWLQADPTLTPERVLDVIAHSCSKPDPAMSYPNNTYGYGQIDVYRGLLYILDTPNRIPQLSDSQPARARFSLHGRRLSVSFDPTTDAAAKEIRLRLFTTDGRLVADLRLDAAAPQADLTDLPSGLYAVQLDTHDERTTGSTLIRLP